jgi:hypothetical protein
MIGCVHAAKLGREPGACTGVAVEAGIRGMNPDGFVIAIVPDRG